jgi:hypothetical protein
VDSGVGQHTVLDFDRSEGMLCFVHVATIAGSILVVVQYVSIVCTAGGCCAAVAATCDFLERINGDCLDDGH